MGSTTQQYCLRWNNHRSNLLAVFDQLLQSESFTDVTLACEGASVKCHKMVLAACSSYFQNLFMDNSCQHPIVVLKDIKYTEIKAILEYMYRGEVNVAQDQLSGLLKVAEALKVKGLVEENGQATATAGTPTSSAQSPPSVTTSASISNVPPVMPRCVSSPLPTPNITTFTNPFAKSYMYDKSTTFSASIDHTRMPLPMWAVPTLPLPPPPPNMINNYETAVRDLSPLKRKKLSSMMCRDTPILRTVLGQSQTSGNTDSSQPVSLVCHSDSQERVQSNGSSQDTEKNSKDSTCDDDQPPPYTDVSVVDDDINDKMNKIIPVSGHPTFSGDMKSISSGIATYVPTQKPEWKRYKQYTRNDIMAAIEAVKNGMSALQAARKYGVPSRTLYDKVKKLGITTSRPFKRGSFPFGLKSDSLSNCSPGGYMGIPENDEPPPLEPCMLHVPGQLGGIVKNEIDRDMMSSSMVGAGLLSPRRSPCSPGMKYMSEDRLQRSLSPSPTVNDMHDEVEDLSIGRKEAQVLPLNISKIKEDMDGVRRDSHREVHMDGIQDMREDIRGNGVEESRE